MSEPRDVTPPTLSLPPGREQASTQEMDFPLHLSGVGRTDQIPELRPAPMPAGGRPQVPGYEILKELGRGGMGIVFLARQTALDRLVALKMILEGHFATAADRRRFLTEAAVIAQLQHPHIVQVHEFSTTSDGHPYFSMEYVHGGTLADLLGKQPQPPRPAAALIAQLADAIQAAHARNIIHRDLKPANILLRRKSDSLAANSETNPKSEPEKNQTKGRRVSDLGSSDFGFVSDFEVRISDFGLAKQLTLGDGVTATGAIIGTPSYMAPEQAGGSSAHSPPSHGEEGRGGSVGVGPAADIYSLGAILYELLTGRPPFQGLNAMETAMQVIAAEPVPPRRLVPTVPRDLETVCLKCLHKEPQRRYATAADLTADLRRFLDGQPVLARPVGRLERLAKWAKRRPAVAGLTTALVVVLLGSVAGLSWLYLDAERQRQEAVQAKDEARLAEAKAKTAESQARKSAAQAEAINRFFIHDFLANIIPAQARSRTITLEEVLSRAASRLGEVFAEQPELEFQMRAIVGRAYTDLGRFADALPHLERAYRLGQELYGPDHNLTLVARTNLATLRNRLNVESPDLKEMRDLLAQREQELGPDHSETLTVMNNLAQLLLQQGKGQEAEQCYRTILERAQRTLGANHRLTLSVQNNLGFLLFRLDRAAEAEPLLRTSVLGLRNILGREDPATLSAESNWALALVSLGRDDEAVTLFRRTLEARQRILGPEHADTLTAMHNIAGVLYKQQRFAEAEEQFRHVLILRRKHLGPEHPDTVVTLDHLSQAIFRQKKHDEAVPLLRELYGLYRRKHGQTHPQTLRTLGNLASEMSNAGQHLEAEPLFRQLHAIQQETLGPEHPATLATLMQQGYCRLQAGSPSEAEPLLRRCVEARRRVLGPVHPDTQTTILQWVRALASTGRAEEAEKLLLETQRLTEQIRVPTAQQREVLAKLLQFYEETQQPARAEPWRKKLEASEAR